MTTKKRGRGRPKKKQSLTSQTSSSTPKFFDIKTGSIAKVQPEEAQEEQAVKQPIAKDVLSKDFSILIDNETVNSDVRFIEEGDTDVRDLFLADFYLRDYRFREFINGIVVMAAREKANRINSELRSLV